MFISIVFLLFHRIKIILKFCRFLFLWYRDHVSRQKQSSGGVLQKLLFYNVAFMHLSKPQEMPVRYLIFVVYLLVCPAWNRLKDDKFDIEFSATVAAQK